MSECKIGVFLCHCGSNIAGVLDMEKLEEYTKTLANVVYVERNLYTCSEPGLKSIREAIAKHKLERVVVAACSPRTHEPTFRITVSAAGLNPYLFEFANIRDQCSWVHGNDPEAALEKAKDLVRMGVARAALLEPLEVIEADVLPSAMVVGGGIAGMTASLDLAGRGFDVTLVEKEKELGGLLRHHFKLYPSEIDSKEFLGSVIARLEANGKVKVLTGSTMEAVKGCIGDYAVTVNHAGTEVEIKVGVIIIATGAKVFEPVNMYGYDGEKVVTQQQYEEMLRSGLENVGNVVMIQCVGARVKERGYCSKICCMTALKNALETLKQNPKANIYVLYSDMMAFGIENEERYREARVRGVSFIRCSPEVTNPKIESGSVVAFDQELQENLRIPCDVLVLSTPLVPHEDSQELGQLLKISRDEDGFFLEAHVKLRPVDFATDGVFLCGCAHWPVDVSETLAQAHAAAARASIPLAQGRVKVEPCVSAFIDEDLCRGCGLCVYVCPYGAIEVVETENGPKAKITEVSCKGCGVCAATCYRRALRIKHFTNEQIEAQINALLEVR